MKWFLKILTAVLMFSNATVAVAGEAKKSSNLFKFSLTSETATCPKKAAMEKFDTWLRENPFAILKRKKYEEIITFNDNGGASCTVKVTALYELPNR